MVKPLKVMLLEMSRTLYEGPARSAIHLIKFADTARVEFLPVFSLPEDEMNKLQALIGMDAKRIVMPRPRISASPGAVAGFAAGTIRASRAIEKLIVEWKPDVVHTNSIINVHAALAAGRRNVPFLLTVREMLPDRNVNRKYVKWICSRADAVHAVSNAVLNKLVAMGADEKKIKVIHNGIETIEVAKERLNEYRKEFGESPVIGIVGSISELKGNHVLMQAAAKIKDRFPGMKIVVVGEAQQDSLDYFEELKNDVRGLGLENNVIFTGRRDDVREMMAFFDLLVHPSTGDDSLPRTILEAASAGTAVVASGIGGIPEMIIDGTTARLVKPGSPESLAQALGDILGDEGQRREMGRAALEHVKKEFDVKAQTAKVLDMYEDILKRRGRA